MANPPTSAFGRTVRTAINVGKSLAGAGIGGFIMHGALGFNILQHPAVMVSLCAALVAYNISYARQYDPGQPKPPSL